LKEGSDKQRLAEEFEKAHKRLDSKRAAQWLAAERASPSLNADSMLTRALLTLFSVMQD